jgi:hypothetical protein
MNMYFVCYTSLLILLSDYMGNNLYWCDSERATVEIMSLTTLKSALLLHTWEGETPLDIALVPVEG